MSQNGDVAIIAAGAEVLRDGAACLTDAADRLGADFVATVRTMSASGSFTMVVGMGKSGYIGRKFVASLLSTGHGAAFMHPADALHGDIGIAEHSTLAILLSHSGNTDELVTLIPMLKQFDIPSALIARDRDCALNEYVDWIIETGVNKEAGIAGLAPTSSSTTTLALCDALVMASLSLRGFSAEQFERYHPGGMLGRNMRKVSDVMIPFERLVWLAPDADIHEVSDKITDGGLGFGVVCDGADAASARVEEIGFITDGDIRRAAGDRTKFPRMTAASIMSRSPKTISKDALAIEALRLMEELAIITLLCSDDGRIAGAVHIHSVVAREMGLAPARGLAPK